MGAKTVCSLVGSIPSPFAFTEFSTYAEKLSYSHYSCCALDSEAPMGLKHHTHGYWWNDRPFGSEEQGGDIIMAGRAYAWLQGSPIPKSSPNPSALCLVNLI
jgi:hypothetical protein